MKKFDWGAFGKEENKIAVWCKTEEEAIDFCQLSYENGYDWYDGKKRSQFTYWEVYKETTCYITDEYADKIFYVNEGYLILPWSDYMVAPKPTFTKSDLKDGDFVLRRNGDIEIALPSLGAFVSDRGYMDFDSVADDLSHFDGSSPVSEDEDWDIIEVRRPSKVHHCQFDCFQNGWGEVVYERSEVVEMTMEEICEALGKKIKIVGKIKTNKNKDKICVGDRVVMVEDFSKNEYYKEYYPPIGTFGIVSRLSSDDAIAVVWDSDVRDAGEASWFCGYEDIEVIS